MNHYQVFRALTDWPGLSAYSLTTHHRYPRRYQPLAWRAGHSLYLWRAQAMEVLVVQYTNNTIQKLSTSYLFSLVPRGFTARFVRNVTLSSSAGFVPRLAELFF